MDTGLGALLSQGVMSASTGPSSSPAIFQTGPLRDLYLLEANDSIIWNDFERLQTLNFETIAIVTNHLRWGLSPDMEEDQRH